MYVYLLVLQYSVFLMCVAYEYAACEFLRKCYHICRKYHTADGTFMLRPCSVTKFQIPIFFRHLHGDLNLDEIKNALRLLSVNGETNLMNLIRL